jgi:hypothetical protein
VYDEGRVKKFETIKAYNLAIARYLKNIGEAIEASIALNKERSRGGMRESTELRRSENIAMLFRLEAYKRVSRRVEGFPVAVTYECLTEEVNGGGWEDVSSEGGESTCGRKPDAPITTTTTKTMTAPKAINYSQEEGSLPSIPSSGPPSTLTSPSRKIPGTPKKKTKTSMEPKISVGGSVKSNLINAITCLYPRFFPNRYSTALSSVMGNKTSKDDSDLLDNVVIVAFAELKKIWGVGVVTAAKLVDWGVRDIEGLKKDSEVMYQLNSQQRIGVDRYYDLIEPIPRDEVEEIAATVKKTVDSICRGEVKIVVCGR